MAETLTPVTWVNSDRTVLVTLYGDSGLMTVALRDEPGHIWGPPVTVRMEQPS